MNIFDESSRAGKWARDANRQPVRKWVGVFVMAAVLAVVAWEVYLITHGAQ